MLQTITGEVEAIGSSVTKNDETFYDYVRILKNNGEVELLKPVKVRATVASYMQPGLEGAFYTCGTEERLILAADINGRFASDFDAFVTDHKAGSIVLKGMFILPIALFLLGAVLEQGTGGGIALLGLVLAFPCWGIGLFRTLPAVRRCRVPSVEEFEAARAATKAATA